MAFGFVDGVQFVASSPGTGSFVANYATSSFLSPSQANANGALINGQTVSYLAQDSLATPSQREWGHGVYNSPNTITRNVTLGNSLGTTALVNFNIPPTVSLIALDEDLLTTNNSWQMLAASAVAASTSGTGEQALATITVPANAMGANGVLRITTHFSFPNNSNGKTPRVRWSGIGGTNILGVSALTTVNASCGQLQLTNRNATNSQVCNVGGGGGWAAVTVAVLATAVDTTVSQTLVITGQCAVGTDVMTLESYSVELLARPSPLLNLVDGVSFIAASGGTTRPFVFSAARSSFLTLAQANSNGNLIDGQVVSYVAQDSVTLPTQREWGHGTYSLSGNSITPTTVLGPTLGTPTNFAVAPTVDLTALAEDLITNSTTSWQVIAQSGVGNSLTGTLTETTLASITIPAGAMGANGVLRITTQWSNNNSAGNKTGNIKFTDGTTPTLYSTFTNTTNQSTHWHTQIHNRNSASSQVSNGVQGGTGGWSGQALATITSSLNTASATQILITGVLANVSDTLTLEYYLVELLAQP